VLVGGSVEALCEPHDVPKPPTMSTEGFSELAPAIVVGTRCEVGLKEMLTANTVKKQMVVVARCWMLSEEWACFVSDRCKEYAGASGCGRCQHDRSVIVLWLMSVATVDSSAK